MMSQNRLANLLEKQRRRQIAALLRVCTPQQKEQILASEKERKETAGRVEKL
jgi:hypothetical protein